MIIVQILDLIVALYHVLGRYITKRRREWTEKAHRRAEMKTKQLQEKTRGSSVWARVVRTLKRRWKRWSSWCWCIKQEKKTLALNSSLDDVPASPYARKPTTDTNSDEKKEQYRSQKMAKKEKRWKD